MDTVIGKCGVSAKVLCDSISEAGIRLMTFEITYPRLILSELNTHRMLSKNSASSRAIPFKKMQENLTGRPVRFGQANPGMQDKGTGFDAKIKGRTTGFGKLMPEYTAEEAWEEAGKDAQFWAKAFYEAGYHKQVYNRLVESGQIMKTVLSGTELSNFFWLRDDGAADPSISELARCMREAQAESTPKLLHAGEYHLPYVNFNVVGGDYWIYGEGSEQIFLSVEDAIKVSCARSAAVSFRNTDYGLEKCREVYERLVGDERKHASALEHQASPLNYAVGFPVGATHIDRNGNYWSGNFKGWAQYRQFIEGHNHCEEPINVGTI